MNPSQWKIEFEKLLSKTPTIVDLFSKEWLLGETKHFQNSTAQYDCHPLVCLVVNKGASEKVGIDAEKIEDIFYSLKEKLTDSKIRGIVKTRTWSEFTPLFAELIYAYELQRAGFEVVIEPAKKNAPGPDVQIKNGDLNIAVEVNSVTTNMGMRDDHAKYAQDLLDAQSLAQLVEEYREADRDEKKINQECLRRIEEVKEFDKFWGDKVPSSFGGISPVRKRYKTHGISSLDLRNRKKDARQVEGYSKRILGLFLSRQFFPENYSYDWRIELRKKHDENIRSIHSGAVFNAYYGLKDEGIFYNTPLLERGKKFVPVKTYEHNECDGVFFEESLYSGVLICSILSWSDVIQTPLEYSFFYYEPFGFNNRSILLPRAGINKIKKLSFIRLGKSKFVIRNFLGFVISTRFFETFKRKIFKPKINSF